jgi:hypothetical protein
MYQIYERVFTEVLMVAYRYKNTFYFPKKHPIKVMLFKTPTFASLENITSE